MEDVIQAFPGEPLRNPERSYRFGSVGMRRWEVPNEKIEELIALDLMSSSLRQMLTNNWQQAFGFAREATPLDDALGASVLEQLEGIMEPHLVGTAAAGGWKNKLAKELTEILKSDIETEGDETPLDVLERRADAHYQKSFERGGIGPLFSNLHIGLDTVAEGIVTQIDMDLSAYWLNPVNPLPMTHVQEVLRILKARLREQLTSTTQGPSGDKQQKRKVARKAEWAKITWLSQGLKAGSLKRAHMRDCIHEYCIDIDRRTLEYDNALRTALVSKIQTLDSFYASARAVLEELLGASENQRSTIDADLCAMHEQQGANKYEFDQEKLREFRSILDRHKDHQQTTSSELRQIVAACEPGRTLRRFRGREAQERETLDDRLQEAAISKGRDIHADLESRAQAPQVLGNSLMDRLQERFAGNDVLLASTAREFVNMAATCANVDPSELQPVMVHGAGGVGVPHMPKRVLVLGIPNHPFSNTVRIALIQSLPAGANYVHDVYVHEDPSQLRLLLVDYWMAARFATVTGQLKSRYSAAANANAQNNVLYFCNIDPEGQNGARADLLLPPAGELRSRLEAELWLGGQFSEPAVVTDTNGVFLLCAGLDGATQPRRLGADVRSVVDSADIPLMFQVSGEVMPRVKALNAEGRMALSSKVSAYEQEVKSSHGVTSPEFMRWSEVRTHISRLLN